MTQAARQQNIATIRGLALKPYFQSLSETAQAAEDLKSGIYPSDIEIAREIVACWDSVKLHDWVDFSDVDFERVDVLAGWREQVAQVMVELGEQS